MIITFLGTAAANAFPEAFCKCKNCEQTRLLGGFSLTKRSSILVNNDLIIDLRYALGRLSQITTEKNQRNMNEFWEEAFKNKHIMWGEQPTTSAIETCNHFKSLGFRKILIPGFGYGRNARPFLDSGFEVVGIEISKTAIQLAYHLLGGEIKVFHGSVGDMPFDQDIYDGIFCHALIHLLRSDERKQLLTNCNAQLKSGGLMVFTTISKHASTYGVGEKLDKDLFKTKDGVELFFYDEESIKEEFGQFGLVETTVVEEPSTGKPATKFWKIVCQKAEEI